ncbi:MAG: hypothetical protein KKB76_00300 [Candidatus Omnitrophica bacterium]|nr:hypothetical protein [Candidatus Omnitrophota bacterium]
MMKKVLIAIAILTFSAGGFTQDTTTIGVSLTLPASLELSYWLRWAEGGQDPYEFGHSGEASAIDFGPLGWDENLKLWTAIRYYTVFLIARASGRPYQINQSSTGLVSEADNLNNSFVVTPDYIAEDEIKWAGESVAQGPMPSGDSLGQEGLAAQGERIIYNSNSGESKIIRAYYGLSTGEEGKPGEPITGDRHAGSYSGAVAFTLTLK